MNTLWFFVPLFCIYLSIPLLSAVQKEFRIKIYLYIAVTALIVNVYIPFVIDWVNLTTKTKLIWPFEIKAASEYLLYVIIGYLLHHLTLKPKIRAVIYCLAVIGLFIHMIGTHCLSMQDGAINSLFKGYTKLPCFLYSAGVFVFVKQAFTRRHFRPADRFVAFVQPYTFGIYLTHMYLFVPVAGLLHLLHIDESFTVSAVILKTLITIPLCIVIIYLLRKIPFIKKTVP